MKDSDLYEEIEEIKVKISIEGDDPKLHHSYGNLLQQTGDFDGAVASQKVAIELDSNLPNPHFKLSQVYRKLGRFKEALKEIKIAISIRCNSAVFYHLLGEILLDIGDYSEAKIASFKAVALNPERFNMSENEFKLKVMIKSGEVAIIPAGFRCYTKKNIFGKLNFKQPSMPFDSGFFPPSSIASVIKNPKINLEYPESSLTHAVCTKYERQNDSLLGFGIKFKKSSYAKINSIVENREGMGINRFLDSTCGYYTLDLTHNFILAHYNWHKRATLEQSKGVYDPCLNLKQINEIFNKRIRRMFDLCNSAKICFFVVGEFQKYNYMMVDDDYFDLNDFTELESTIRDVFSAKCFVATVSDIDTADKLFAIANCKT